MRIRCLWIGLSMASLFGCGSELHRSCERADECNLLQGVSVDECTENAERRAEDLNDDEATDLDTMLDECLDWESCDAFRECLNDVGQFNPD